MEEYRVELLTSLHDKNSFDCGKHQLNDYLIKQAKQDLKRRLSVCFVLVGQSNKVIGYYTLSNASVPREQIPEEIKRKMPESYISLPATLLGRLAVDVVSSGKKLGELLLIDALKRSYQVSLTSVGSMAIIVDPLDRNAEFFYSKYGFIKLPDSAKMFLPMATVAQLFQQ